MQYSKVYEVHFSTSSGRIVLVTVDSCGPGQWYRIAYLNMRDSSQECPTNWMEIDSPVRVCGRPRTNGASCVSAFFPSPGPIQYNKVCGRTIGYQNGSTDSFALREVRNIQPTIDNPYVDGISVTHGMPRATFGHFPLVDPMQQSSITFPTVHVLTQLQVSLQHLHRVLLVTTISVSQEIQVEAVLGELCSPVILSGMGSSVREYAATMEGLHHGSV